MKRLTGRFLGTAILCGLVAGLAQPTQGQISPGELSAAHRELDGSDQCLSCHSSGRGVDRDLCLSCHQVLSSRISAGQGLHARTVDTACERCHIEHHGRDFALVWWGEEGMETFDHSQTGYPLEASHRGVACRSCHQPEHIPRPAPLLAEGIDLKRTFLGLGSECSSCHADPHAGQFESTTCSSCHGLQEWRGAERFDHQQTGFPLTGLHRDVSCSDCHQPRAGGDVQYRGLAAETCADCHQDPHQGRLEGTCANCHSTDGWDRTETTGFDHDRTRYPLRGRHRSVACVACHGESLTRSFSSERFDRCETCHRDPHAGQLSQEGRGCDSCHDVAGFEPSLFDQDDHETTGFSLEGAHRNVPCVECHRRVPADSLVRAGLARAPRTRQLLQFRFASSSCESCHRNPHDKSVRALPNGCETCHSPVRWSEVAFDHASTGFFLEGRHADVSCLQCHRESTAGADLKRVGFSTARADCRACHDSPHQGQFGTAEEPNPCARCHDSDSWEPSRFDHRDVYLLVGAHRAVPCRTCHPTEVAGDSTFVRYRPTGRECLDCHGNGGSE